MGPEARSKRGILQFLVITALYIACHGSSRRSALVAAVGSGAGAATASNVKSESIAAKELLTNMMGEGIRVKEGSEGSMACTWMPQRHHGYIERDKVCSIFLSFLLVD